jgi:hypothetical protein
VLVLSALNLLNSEIAAGLSWILIAVVIGLLIHKYAPFPE